VSRTRGVVVVGSSYLKDESGQLPGSETAVTAQARLETELSREIDRLQSEILKHRKTMDGGWMAIELAVEAVEAVVAE
jgi:hypothetical protein